MKPVQVILLYIVAALSLTIIFRAVSSGRRAWPEPVRFAAGALGLYLTLIAALWFECSSWTLLAVVVGAVVGSLAIQRDGLLRLTDVMGRFRLPLYLLSTAAVAVLLLVFVPVTTFLTSPGELDIHLGYLIEVNASDGVLVVYLAAMLYMLAFTPRMRTLLTLIAMTALALTLVYTFAMPFGYPPLSGLTFEQIPLSAGAVALRAVVDVAVVPVVALAVCAAVLRFGAGRLLVAILLVNVSLGIAAAVRVSQPQASTTDGPVSQVPAPERPLRFSRTQPNVLIIMLDRFMGSYVESILQTDADLAERLSGFTWYPRTVSAGHNSIAGVHPMLGGYDYTPVEMNARGQALRDLSIEAFSILPHNFAKHGYQVNLVSPRGLGFTVAGDCSVLRIDGVTCTPFPLTRVRQRAEQMGFALDELAKAGYADLLSLLGSMRGTPYLLKQVLYRKGPWRPFLDKSAGTTFREWAQLEVLPEVSLTDAAEPNFNYVSSLLPHEPYFLGEDCQPLHERFEIAKEEVRRRGHRSLFSVQHSIAARCALLSVADYLDFLKGAGVYDNTRIVIVSDHGIVGRVEDRSTRAVAGGTTSSRYVASRSVLLVKQRDATGALRVSEEFLPNAEVPRIVCEEIGGCVNPYLDDKPIVADGRNDPFYVSIVPWQFSAQKPEAFVIREQRALKGKDPFNARGWTTTE